MLQRHPSPPLVPAPDRPNKRDAAHATLRVAPPRVIEELNPPRQTTRSVARRPHRSATANG